MPFRRTWRIQLAESPRQGAPLASDRAASWGETEPIVGQPGSNMGAAIGTGQGLGEQAPNGRRSGESRPGLEGHRCTRPAGHRPPGHGRERRGRAWRRRRLQSAALRCQPSHPVRREVVSATNPPRDLGPVLLPDKSWQTDDDGASHGAWGLIRGMRRPVAHQTRPGHAKMAVPLRPIDEQSGIKRHPIHIAEAYPVKPTAILATLLCLAACAFAQDPPNLISNPSLEELTPDGFARDWSGGEFGKPGR